MPVTKAEPKTLEEHLAGTGADALVARYLEQHGRWGEEVHRHHAGATVVRVLAYCGCPICTDARAHLKLED